MYISVFLWCADLEIPFDMKVEADDDDITEHPHDGPSDVNFP